MAQIDIAEIQIFHRDDYPNNATSKIVAGDVVDTISVIVNPSFTQLENKTDVFFSFRPRRFSFSVRSGDTSFITTTRFAANVNFPELSNYMVRVFDTSDGLIFEGIIDVKVEHNENNDLFTVLCYDPLTLLFDNRFGFTPTEMSRISNMEDPIELFGLLITTLYTLYFSSSVYRPYYDASFTIPDLGLANYQDIVDFSTYVSEFYVYSRITGKNVALGKMQGVDPSSTITDVYDFSRLDIYRPPNSQQNLVMRRVCVDLVLLIVYYDSVNDIWCALVGEPRMAQYDLTNGAESIVFDYPDPSDGVTNAYQKSPATTHADFHLAKFVGKGLPYKKPYDSSANWIYNYFIAQTEYREIYHTVFSRSSYYAVFFPGYFDFKGNEMFPAALKTYLLTRKYPNWNSGTTIMEYASDYNINSVGLDYMRYYRDMSKLHLQNNVLLLQGSNVATMTDDDPIEMESDDTDYPSEREYVYGEFYGYMYYGNFVNPSEPQAAVVQTDVISNETGYYRMWDNTGNLENYKIMQLKVNYTQIFDLDFNSFGVAEGKFHKIGSISKFYKYFPTSVQIKNIDSSDAVNYIFNTDLEQNIEIQSWMQMVLATMGIYLYYDGGFKVQGILTSGSTVTISESDVIEWTQKGEDTSAVDIRSVVQPVVNYTFNAMNSYYNTVMSNDNNRANCKISRLFTNYSLSLNDKVSIDSDIWRIEAINSYVAYHEVVLTKNY